MPAIRIFLDSNFLVYQRDTSDQNKHARARAWTLEILNANVPTVTGWQCLREYYSVATRKKVLLSRETAQADVRHWAPLVPAADSDDFEQAWQLEARFGFNFYDCLVLASALNAGATHILTEDMQNDQIVDGIRIVNPFMASLADFAVA